MQLNTIPFEPNSTYVAEGRMSLPGGASVTASAIQITTDGAGRVQAFADGTGGSGAGASLWDYLRVTDTRTGKAWDLRLHTAAQRGDTELAEKALAEGADVHLRIKQGSTALHWAAAKGREEVARLLLAHGAEVDAEDELGWTPAALAAKGGFRGLVALLVGAGARAPAAPAAPAPPPPGDAERKLLEDLERSAREGQTVISESLEVHFGKIVAAMDRVGAVRLGSQQIQGADGRRYVVDIYRLPGGATVKAGYAA